MNNTFRKLLSLTLCLIMVLGSVAVGGNGMTELFDNFAVKASAEETGYEYGDSIYLGKYPQSEITDITGLTENVDYVTVNNKYYAYEPIEWKVLDAKTGLCVSNYALNAMAFDDNSNDYKASNIRAWLYGTDGTGTFYTKAFTDTEKSVILQKDVVTYEYNSNTAISSTLTDKVFLLSVQEASNTSYFADDSARICYPTDYAIANDAIVENEHCYWWLRSPNDYSSYALGVRIIGGVNYDGYYVSNGGVCVRPALYLNLESEIFKFEITLDANNGTGDTVKQAAYKLKSFYPECTFTNKGYAFKGWYIDKECTKVWTEKDVINGNMTLYAKWKAHTYGEWVTVKDSTCTEDGFKYRTCSECGFIETSGIDSTEHSWNADFTIDKDSTCTEDGSKSIHCSKCEAIKPDSSTVVAKKEHTSVTDVAVAATCTTTGLTAGSHCSVCNTVLVAQQATEKKAHNYGEWATVKDSTCTEEGFKYRTCSECGFIETSGIDATEHSWNADYTIDKDSTCTAEGSKSIHCSKCEAIKPDSSTVVAKKEHTSVTDVAVAATCTTTGLTEGSHCSVCNTVLVAQQATEKKAHDYGEWVTVKDSTCTEDGFKYRTCSECGFIETSGIDATEHSWNADYTIDKDSTCTAEGSKSIHCSKCEAIKPDSSTVVAKKEHTSVTDVAVAATCTTTGLTEGSHCSVCNTVLVAQQVIEKKSHNYGEWVTVKDSTCTEDGFKMKTCKDCGFIETSNINISDHEWEDVYTVDKEPTYSEAGSESIHCKHCEAVKDSRSIISISEKFEIEKANVIALLNELGETQDNQYSQNITNEAIQDIENYVYDESKSFEENVKEINAIENVATYKVNTYDNTVNACPFLRFLAKIFETIFSFFSKLFG